MTLLGSPDGFAVYAGWNLSWAMRSDVGHRREINEDSALAEPPLFVVADGMGGYDGGEIASRVVVTRLHALTETGNVGRDDIHQSLRDAIDDLADEGADGSAGTTFTALAVRDGGEPQGEWASYNIGDSRVYQLSGELLIQVTTDHSVVQELIDSGRLTEAEAEQHPHSNVITRAVGFHEDPLPTAESLTVTSGDRFLLCSDGLTKELNSAQLKQLLIECESPAEAAESLLSAALDNGGRDNITVLVIDVHS